MEEIHLQNYHHYLLRAKWIFPVLTPPILNGAIEIKGKNIVKVGNYKELSKEVTSAKIIDFEEAVIVPSLVNAHTHLELSALRFRVPSTGNFISWVKNVIKLRESLTPVEMKESAKITLNNLWKDGIGIIGDVGNTAITLDLLCNSLFYGYFFQEVLSFKGNYSLKELKLKAPCINFKITYSAHAPHTVAPLLIQAIKSYNRRRKKLFCIHCAESQEEVEFLKTGEGSWAHLLKEKRQWNESFTPPQTTPVKYLHQLGVLDKNTLLIHAIHLDEEDLKILKENQVKICICPKSNLYIGVGIPKLKELLSAGIEVCIGTDSLASNDNLSIWEELKTIYTLYPDVSPEDLLKLATLNGAKILGFNKMGAILPGYIPNFLVINVKEYLNDSAEDTLKTLINSEKEVTYRVYA